MNKEERIAAERERLNKLFADLDANQLQAAAGLISSAAFLAVSLEDLEAEINANGYIDSYTNGSNQAGEKISAAVQAYTALNAKYQSTIQKLLKIVPPAPKPKPEKDYTRPANNQNNSWVPKHQTFEEWKAENGITD